MFTEENVKSLKASYEELKNFNRGYGWIYLDNDGDLGDYITASPAITPPSFDAVLYSGYLPLKIGYSELLKSISDTVYASLRR